MSMTLLAIIGLNCGLTTIEMNEYAKTLDVPIDFTHEADLRKHSGFLPVRLAGIEAGVETYFTEDPNTLKLLPPNNAIQSDNSAIVEFRWGGNLKEAATALYIAYILGKKCHAVLFDTEGGDYMLLDEARQGAEAMMSIE